MNKPTKTETQPDLKKELEETKAKYLRALADYQNLEKRVQNASIDEQKFASRNIIFKILPVLDVLEKVEVTSEDQGVKLAVKMFRKILEENQVLKFEVIGKKFDPVMMECVEVLGDGKDDKVTEEVQSGYMMHGQILRVAKVKVGKKTAEKTENIDSKVNIKG